LGLGTESGSSLTIAGFNVCILKIGKLNSMVQISTEKLRRYTASDPELYTGFVCRTTFDRNSIQRDAITKVADPVHAEPTDLDGDGVLGIGHTER
jgi:hypothetical protein